MGGRYAVPDDLNDLADVIERDGGEITLGDEAAKVYAASFATLLRRARMSVTGTHPGIELRVVRRWADGTEHEMSRATSDRMYHHARTCRAQVHGGHAWHELTRSWVYPVDGAKPYQVIGEYRAVDLILPVSPGWLEEVDP